MITAQKLMYMSGKPASDPNRPPLDGYTIILDRPISSVQYVYWDYNDVNGKSLLTDDIDYFVYPPSDSAPGLVSPQKLTTIGWVSPWQPPQTSNPNELLALLSARIVTPTDNPNPNCYRWLPTADMPRVSVAQFTLRNACDGCDADSPPIIYVFFDLGPNWINP
jgi:hypothetical protein